MGRLDAQEVSGLQAFTSYAQRETRLGALCIVLRELPNLYGGDVDRSRGGWSRVLL